MYLLEPAILSIFATNLLVGIGLALLAALGIRHFKLSRKSYPLLFVAILTFALLGFVTGEIMGQSRTPVVGAVLPAVLTLLGSVAIYLIGSKGPETQAMVASMVLCFTIALLGGSLYGARLRIEFEAGLVTPEHLKARELALEHNRYALELQRLLNYTELLKLKRELAEKEKVDLSRFESASERKLESSKP